jgi:hypothetical protein
MASQSPCCLSQFSCPAVLKDFSMGDSAPPEMRGSAHLPIVVLIAAGTQRIDQREQSSTVGRRIQSCVELAIKVAQAHRVRFKLKPVEVMLCETQGVSAVMAQGESQCFGLKQGPDFVSFADFFR